MISQGYKYTVILHDNGIVANKAVLFFGLDQAEQNNVRSAGLSLAESINVNTQILAANKFTLGREVVFLSQIAYTRSIWSGKTNHVR